MKFIGLRTTKEVAIETINEQRENLRKGLAAVKSGNITEIDFGRRAVSRLTDAPLGSVVLHNGRIGGERGLYVSESAFWLYGDQYVGKLIEFGELE